MNGTPSYGIPNVKLTVAATTRNPVPERGLPRANLILTPYATEIERLDDEITVAPIEASESETDRVDIRSGRRFLPGR